MKQNEIEVGKTYLIAYEDGKRSYHGEATVLILPDKGSQEFICSIPTDSHEKYIFYPPDFVREFDKQQPRTFTDEQVEAIRRKAFEAGALKIIHTKKGAAMAYETWAKENPL